MTSDGGLLLLREVEQRLDLISRIDHAKPYPRDPLHTVYPQTEILTSRIFGIAAGYGYTNDHNRLRHDPTFQVATGRIGGNILEVQWRSFAKRTRFDPVADTEAFRTIRLHRRQLMKAIPVLAS